MAIDGFELKIIAMNPRSLSIPVRLLEYHGYSDVGFRADIKDWCSSNSIVVTLHYTPDSNSMFTYNSKSVVVAKFGSVEQAFEFKMRWF